MAIPKPIHKLLAMRNLRVHPAGSSRFQPLAKLSRRNW